MMSLNKLKTALKHMSGKHNQKLHGVRYNYDAQLGSTVTFTGKKANPGGMARPAIDDKGNHVYVRAGYKYGDYLDEQQLSYEVAKLLGMEDLVPPTKSIKAPEDEEADEYVMTEAVDGKTMGQFIRSGDDFSRIDPVTAKKLVILDAISGNHDRNLGNYIVRPDGTIAAIDNDTWTTIEIKNQRTDNAWMIFRDNGVLTEYPTQEIKDAARLLYNSGEFRNMIRQGSADQTMGETQVMERIEAILSPEYDNV